MQVLRLVIHIAILFVFYWLGTWIEHALHLFIPGSVIGMLLFLFCLLTGIFKPKWAEEGASLLIRHLPLLFLPITVGAIEYLDLFKGAGIWIVVIALVSTAMVMLIGGAVTQVLIRRKEGRSQC
ncbi:CidA/LrgA family protein [Aciduricibacillus chroicocephali]|uniref:CidA/LrgA family protein n=1 Tax=Aciduricibacillus chroicocephali TaxID=3054939 RepID=A0ABY9KTS7_9BACI|nr:CidA/LrgA family protein [Bacillaceae bacterium 44XB]